jgi:hypothetical protein
MIGLLATYFAVAYLLVPSGLFRLFYSLFLPRIIKFQRTRVEEFTFAILSAILPFLLALALSWTSPIQPFGVEGRSAADRRQAYRTFIAPAISDKTFGESKGQEVAYWSAANQVFRRQASFLTWYYLLVLLEAYIYARLTAHYGSWRESLTGRKRRLYLKVAEKVLLPSVSEWHLLLTPFYYPPKPQRQVWVDVLTTLDILYKGHVNEYFLDKEGELSGLLLESPRRFDRQGLLRDIAVGTKRDTRAYWRDIPSNNLYISSDKITNLNVRYLTAEEVVALGASARLQGEGLPFDVEPATDLLDPVLLPLADLFESDKGYFAVIQALSKDEEVPLREFLAQQVADGLMQEARGAYRLTAKGYTTYLPRIRYLRGGTS